MKRLSLALALFSASLGCDRSRSTAGKDTSNQPSPSAATAPSSAASAPAAASASDRLSRARRSRSSSTASPRHGVSFGRPHRNLHALMRRGRRAYTDAQGRPLAKYTARLHLAVHSIVDPHDLRTSPAGPGQIRPDHWSDRVRRSRNSARRTTAKAPKTPEDENLNRSLPLLASRASWRFVSPRLEDLGMRPMVRIRPARRPGGLVEHLPTVRESVDAAVEAALEHWSTAGTPDSPRAWLGGATAEPEGRTVRCPGDCGDQSDRGATQRASTRPLSGMRSASALRRARLSSARRGASPCPGRTRAPRGSR